MDNFLSINENMLNHEKNLSSNASFSSSAVRFKNEVKNDFRTEFERDIDKIIYSLSYTRYIDKTQVYSTRDNDNISKRMTHVQYVSRISKTIARALGLNEDLCEAIALGHDIGHVPYAHEGEYILNDISKEKLGKCFAHNLHSVRSFMYVENNGEGINLTVQTLDGIMCHNGELLQDKYKPQFKTKEDFLKQYESCVRDEKNIKKILPMTLEGCIVRISDIVSYIGKDIEDAIRLKMLNACDIPKDITDVLGATNSQIINTIIYDIVDNSYGKDYISMSKIVFEKMNALKKINYDLIYSKALTDIQKVELNRKFRALYDVYNNAIINKDTKNSIWKEFLNNMDEKYLKNNLPGEIAIDYIAGMTDNYFEREYKKYLK